MGRTACAEPQCLYKDALYLFTLPVSKKTGIFQQSCQGICSDIVSFEGGGGNTSPITQIIECYIGHCQSSEVPLYLQVQWSCPCSYHRMAIAVTLVYEELLPIALAGGLRRGSVAARSVRT